MLIKKIKQTFKSDRGSAIIWALIVFVVVSFAASTIIFIQRADVDEVMLLEDRLTAYYISYGGMEFGLAALMTEYKGSGKTFFDEYVSNKGSYNELNQELDFNEDPDNKSSKVIGTASIKIYKKNIFNTDWVIVESIGKSANGKAKSVNYMRINAANPYEIHRDGDTLPKDN